MIHLTTRWAQPVVILLLGLSALELSTAAEGSDLASLQWIGLETEASTDLNRACPNAAVF